MKSLSKKVKSNDILATVLVWLSWWLIIRFTPSLHWRNKVRSNLTYSFRNIKITLLANIRVYGFLATANSYCISKHIDRVCPNIYLINISRHHNILLRVPCKWLQQLVLHNATCKTTRNRKFFKKPFIGHATWARKKKLPPSPPSSSSSKTQKTATEKRAQVSKRIKNGLSSWELQVFYENEWAVGFIVLDRQCVRLCVGAFVWYG